MFDPKCQQNILSRYLERDRTEQEINNRKELVELGDLYFENVTETFYSKVLYPSWASR